MTKFNAIFQTDSYKLSHFGQMPPKATELYSHLTPRNNHYLKQKFPLMGDKVVVYGTTGVTKLLVEMWDENFFNLDWEIVKEQALNLLNPFVGIVEEDLEKFKKLHDLQYLPLEIKSLDEGSHVSVNIPVLTVRNTHPDFYWLTNFIEPFLLSNIYKPMSVATLTLELARLRNYWFSTTVEDHSGIDYALHDFSYRGHACTESAAFSLSAYLLYTKGTDTLSAIDFAQRYYNADNTIANSLPAFEHSTASLGIQYYRKALDVTDPVSLYGLPKEFVDKALTACLQVKESLLSKGITSTEEIELAIGETFNLARALLLIYPTGLFAYVADTYDYQRLLTVIVPALKDIILSRDGKLILRPDSGNPVKVLCGDDHSDNDHEYCGTIEILWGIFGGHLNIHGYQELDNHIGVVYGDGMNFKNIQLIYMKLASKGFAVSNVCLSGGAYMLSAITRDDLGFAIKGSNAIVNGVSTPIYKQPKTDMSKASPKGYLKVTKDGEEFVLHSNVSKEEEKKGELKTIFFDGHYVDHPSFGTIKQRVAELAKV